MLILLLVIAPLGTGLIMNRFIETDERSLGMTYISGFLILLAAFQLITVPIVFLKAWGFRLVVDVFNVVTTLLTGFGIIQALHLWRREGRIFYKRFSLPKKLSLVQVQWLIVFVLIGFQLFMAVNYASFDGDDAYYVAHSLATEETNTLYRILPYTGRSTSLDMRHSMAVFPIWIAYVARMTGIHATVLSHTILPLALIPLTYGIFYEIGKKLCKEKDTQLPTYMMFVCMLQIFGNVSIYNNATFLLMRTWQGKSMLANVVIPAVFMVLLWIFEEEPQKRSKRNGLWWLLFVLNIVAAMMSTASVFLNTFLLVVMAVVLYWQEKDWKILVKMVACCIPCVVYAVIYLIV